MIILLGTSHVSTHSKKQVEAAILDADVVAIELDVGRAQAIMTGERATFSEMRQAIGLRAATLATILRSVQERVAKSLGVVPGLEMKAALEAGNASGKPVALIDRDVRVTIKRLTASVGGREIWTMCKDMFRRRKMSAHPSDELVLELLGEMRERYPRVYQAMVSERDAYMARQLLGLQQKFPEKRILAVVGMGHVPGMARHLEETGLSFEIASGNL